MENPERISLRNFKTFDKFSAQVAGLWIGLRKVSCVLPFLSFLRLLLNSPASVGVSTSFVLARKEPRWVTPFELQGRRLAMHRRHQDG